MTTFKRLLTYARQHARYAEVFPRARRAYVGAGCATAITLALGATFGSSILPKATAHADSISDSRSWVSRKVTSNDVATHNTAESGWVVIDGQVYDVTDFLALHPGGEEVLTENLGKDISQIFHLLHSSDVCPDDILQLRSVGRLSEGRNLDTAETSVGDVQSRRDQLPDIKFVTNIKSFEMMAKAVLGEDSKAWEFISSAAEDGNTLVSNRLSFSFVRFLPRVNIPVGTISTSTTFLGSPVPVPLMISPTGGAANAHPDADFNGTIASSELGVPHIVSSMSSIAFSELADKRDQLESEGKPPANLWWQLYIMNDRLESERRICNAVNNGAKAIVITVDVATPGKREVAGKVFEGHGSKRGTGKPTDTISPDRFTSDLSWDDISWVKSIAPGVPILVKGVATVEDVALAKQYGADGVILSNHGGRQLDHAPPPLSTLVHLRLNHPDLLDAPKFDVYLDGGIQRGTDVLKALCIGAKGVGLGRALLYAQACYGAEGVTHALQILTSEIEIGMRLLGARSIDELTPAMVELLDGGLVGKPLG